MALQRCGLIGTTLLHLVKHQNPQQPLTLGGWAPTSEFWVSGLESKNLHF